MGSVGSNVPKLYLSFARHCQEIPAETTSAILGTGPAGPEQEVVVACLYKRKNVFWASYYLDGKQVKKSLQTSDERTAKNKFRKLEYELTSGELQLASKMPLEEILEAFCRHLAGTRTYKSCKNDYSRLRIFFGPLCESLKLGKPRCGWGSSRVGRSGSRIAQKSSSAALSALLVWFWPARSGPRLRQQLFPWA